MWNTYEMYIIYFNKYQTNKINQKFFQFKYKSSTGH